MRRFIFKLAAIFALTLAGSATAQTAGGYISVGGPIRVPAAPPAGSTNSVPPPPVAGNSTQPPNAPTNGNAGGSRSGKPGKGSGLTKEQSNVINMLTGLVLNAPRIVQPRPEGWNGDLDDSSKTVPPPATTPPAATPRR